MRCKIRTLGKCIAEENMPMRSRAVYVTTEMPNYFAFHRQDNRAKATASKTKSRKTACSLNDQFGKSGGSRLGYNQVKCVRNLTDNLCR